MINLLKILLICLEKILIKYNYIFYYKIYISELFYS